MLHICCLKQSHWLSRIHRGSPNVWVWFTDGSAELKPNGVPLAAITGLSQHHAWRTNSRHSCSVGWARLNYMALAYTLPEKPCQNLTVLSRGRLKTSVFSITNWWNKPQLQSQSSGLLTQIPMLAEIKLLIKPASYKLPRLPTGLRHCTDRGYLSTITHWEQRKASFFIFDVESTTAC